MGALDIDKGQVKNIYAIAAKLGMVDRSSHEDALHELVQGLTGKTSVDNMILTCTVRLPEIQAYIEEQAGVDVSTSTISRYGKRLSETYRDLTIAQENFEALRKELEKYPEQDSAEILTRIASHKMMAALVSKSDKDWNEMRADKLLKEISGLTRAMAYKQRVDIQNKDVVSAALDEVQASVFSALADEKPELYRQVVQFLDKKRKEGL